MRFSAVSEEVLYTTEPITSVSRSDIALLKSMAMKNTRKRIRLCAHPDTDDPLHEMIIVHARGAYIRPHKHPGKSESFHIIEGRLKVVIFEEDGGIRDVLRMGKSGDQILYYRLS
jgi:cupin fold WbuC family metalloprotein